jgi:hypothetical protein
MLPQLMFLLVLVINEFGKNKFLIPIKLKKMSRNEVYLKQLQQLDTARKTCDVIDSPHCNRPLITTLAFAQPVFSL